MSELTIQKRDGSREAFSERKLKASVEKAYAAVDMDLEDGEFEAIRGELKVYDGMKVEDLQDQLEHALFKKGFYKAAKAYMMYRSKNKEDRETLDKLNFLMNYCEAENAATGSKYDANANVEKKNIATLIGELPKSNFIRLNRRMLTDRIKQMYNKETAEKYLDLLNHHFIYKNDETSLANYCASITMYPWLIGGTKSIGGNSTPPTNLKSFCGGFVNMVFIVSSMLSGACATPEFLMYMNYFLQKEYGEDYWKRNDEIVDLSIRKRSIDKVITDCFEQVVYSINQPTGARNFQAVFWNISYYDRYYFNSLFENFYFPDGSKPDWDSLNWLQKRFMKWFNAERLRTPLTFPVETMALLADENGDIKDKEYADFTAEMYAEGHSFFTYVSDNADSLSSCCFDKDQKVLWKSSTNGVMMTTLEELHNMKWEPSKKNLRIFHNGSWVKGKSIKLPNMGDMYKIVTGNNKEFVMTGNHINVTLNGEKEAKDLVVGDYLMFNTVAANAIPENDEKLTYEEGFVIGAFLGDGSMGSTIKDTIYDVNFSQNENKYKVLVEHLNKANKQIGGANDATLSQTYNNVYPVRICSKELVEFIKKWTLWERGTYAYNKKLNLNVLSQSIEFRRGILDGWYNTDGGNSNRCYTTSKELAEDMEVLIMSLGMQSMVNVSDKTDEPVIIRGEEYNRNYPLYCVRWYEPTNDRSNRDPETNWIKRNNSTYFRIKSIEKVPYKDDVYCIECHNEDEPYFTLPCGLITHNCRLRNEITDNGFSYTLGAGGISTGSKSVLTINLNRAIQYAVNNGIKYQDYIEEVVDLMHKVQIAYNENLKALQAKGMLPLFDAGYINIGRQYLTIGVNGLVEGAEFLGIEIGDNDQYAHYVQEVLGIVEKLNKQYRTKDMMFNCEMIPAENVGVKHAKWDKEDGYVVPRDCYNSYFYVVEDNKVNIIDKFKMHGKKYIEHLTGGSALHCNLDEHLSKEQYRQLLRVAAQEGCNYFTFNVPNTVCNKCGHIDKRHLHKCPVCGSEDLDYLTRIIGYLKRVSNFSAPRKAEAAHRYYANMRDNQNTEMFAVRE